MMSDRLKTKTMQEKRMMVGKFARSGGAAGVIDFEHYFLGIFL